VTIRVVICDDQNLIRAGFRVLLDSAPDIEVVGEAGNGREAIDVVGRERPDVALMDIRMPEMDGLEATHQLLTTPGLEDLRVLVLTTFDLDEYVYRALRAGASGFLLKDTEPAQLIDAVRIVARGDALLAPAITRRLIADFARRPDDVGRRPEELKGLTDREREVLILVGRGMSNDEIAEYLVISPATAKTHVSRIMGKLDARDRSQLVVFAYESGLVEPRATP
jgi:DNA-binding NarL/FixJ family response regulator